MTTFAQILSRQLASDPGRPLVTFYDDASGERTELSVTTWANWVAKVASLLADELEVEHGSRLLVDLPTHWLGTVVLGAAWRCGFEVVWDDAEGVDAEGVDAVVTGPDGVAGWASRAAKLPVVASALQPLAGRFPDGVPDGVHDLGVEVWSQPDAFTPYPEPEGSDMAVAGMTQDELWTTAAAGELLTDGGRLLSEANPASPSGLASLTEPLTRGGSLVLLDHAAQERREHVAVVERVTHRFVPGAHG
jgi:uncharacterized protein (TIGR03089 family)